MSKMGRSPDSPQIHQNTSRYGTTPTKQLLGDNRRPQGSRGQSKLPGMRYERGWRNKKGKDGELLDRRSCPEEGRVS